MNRLHLLPPLMFLLGGCAGWSDNFKSPSVPTNPWLSTPPCTAKAGACTQAEAIAAVAKAQNFCMELREFHERGGQISGGQRLFVGVLGSLAGSVFATTAGGTAAKAWSGLSGATNGIQLQIDQASGKPGGPLLVQEIANVQIAAAAEIKELMAASVRTTVWDPVAIAAVLLPDRCSAAAGIGFAKQQDKAASEAAAASAAQAKAVLALAAAASAASAATAGR